MAFFRSLAVGAALGCAGVAAGNPSALPLALCRDATQKDVEKDGGLVHEHLQEIEKACKKRKSPGKCENAKVVRIGAAKANVTEFYVNHCMMHVAEDMGKKKPSLKTLHPLVDKFEEGHAKEIKAELHDGIHAAMKGEVRMMLKVLCGDEVQKAIENDGGLIHEHLKEIEESCKEKSAACEQTAVTELLTGKSNVAFFFTQHCFEHVPPKKGATLKTLHPAVDKFAEDHKAEIKEKLHDAIHGAMKVAGLQAKFEMTGISSEGDKITGRGLGLAAGLLGSMSVIGSFVVVRRLRRSGTATPAEDIEGLQEKLGEE